MIAITKACTVILALILFIPIFARLYAKLWEAMNWDEDFPETELWGRDYFDD